MCKFVVVFCLAAMIYVSATPTPYDARYGFSDSHQRDSYQDFGNEEHHGRGVADDHQKVVEHQGGVFEGVHYSANFDDVHQESEFDTEHQSMVFGNEHHGEGEFDDQGKGFGGGHQKSGFGNRHLETNYGAEHQTGFEQAHHDQTHALDHQLLGSHTNDYDIVIPISYEHRQC